MDVWSISTLGLESKLNGLGGQEQTIFYEPPATLERDFSPFSRNWNSAPRSRTHNKNYLIKITQRNVPISDVILKKPDNEENRLSYRISDEQRPFSSMQSHFPGLVEGGREEGTATFSTFSFCFCSSHAFRFQPKTELVLEIVAIEVSKKPTILSCDKPLVGMFRLSTKSPCFEMVS